MGSCVSWQRCEIALVFFRSRIGIISGISSAPFVALLCHKKAALVTCKTVKQKSYIQIECSFSVAERKGFEPLRALWALHDFQSCALDQLSHLSIFDFVSSNLRFTIQFITAQQTRPRVPQDCLSIIPVHTVNVKAFLQLFSKICKFKKEQILHLQIMSVRAKTY